MSTMEGINKLHDWTNAKEKKKKEFQQTTQRLRESSLALDSISRFGPIGSGRPNNTTKADEPAQTTSSSRLNPQSQPFQPTNHSSSPARQASEHGKGTSSTTGQAAPPKSPPAGVGHAEEPVEELSVDPTQLRWAATEPVELHLFNGKEAHTVSPPDGLLAVMTHGSDYTTRPGMEGDCRDWHLHFVKANQEATISHQLPSIVQHETKLQMHTFLDTDEDYSFFVDIMEVSEDQVALRVDVYQYKPREYKSNSGTPGFSKDWTSNRTGLQPVDSNLQSLLDTRKSSRKASDPPISKRWPAKMTEVDEAKHKAAFYSKPNENIGKSLDATTHVGLLSPSCEHDETVTNEPASDANGS